MGKVATFLSLFLFAIGATASEKEVETKRLDKTLDREILAYSHGQPGDIRMRCRRSGRGPTYDTASCTCQSYRPPLTISIVAPQTYCPRGIIYNVSSGMWRPEF